MPISFGLRCDECAHRSIAGTERGFAPDTEYVLRLKPRGFVLGDALIWIGAPPMLVLLGVLSNLGGFLHLPDRYGLPHCRARIHRAECRVRGPSAGVIGFGSWVAARNLGRWKIGRLNGRYLCGEECIALNILNDITRRQNGFTYAEAQIHECRRLERRRAY